MKTYMVGGAVRDQLLGLDISDRDYVVVGSTPEAMLAEGYKPVGKDFPVFLHPDSKEGYALARAQRQSSPGFHHGVAIYASPTVTLEEDLARRDLTINAMAIDRQGTLIDPFNGLADLRAGILRHVSPAFAEDPVRILRTARFSSRYGFQVAPETMALMRQIVDAGEVNTLVAERVWAELAKGLMTSQPSLMFNTLRECGALARILPELDDLWGVPQTPAHHPEIDTGVHTMLVVDYAAKQGWNLATRWAALLHDLGKGRTPKEEWPQHIAHEARGVRLVKAVCDRLKVPTYCRDLACHTTRYHGDIHRGLLLKPATILKLLLSVDAIRKPHQFNDLLNACLADSRGRTGFENREYPQADRLRQAHIAATSINGKEIANSLINGNKRIAELIARARLKAITTMTPLSASRAGADVWA